MGAFAEVDVSISVNTYINFYLSITHEKTLDVSVSRTIAYGAGV